MKLFKTAALIMLAGVLSSTAIYAAETVIEEVIVTARQQSEGLQDVPVTISALTEEDLDRYNITNLVDAAKMVPNMVIAQGGSGNGSRAAQEGEPAGGALHRFVAALSGLRPATGERAE